MGWHQLRTGPPENARHPGVNRGLAAVTGHAGISAIPSFHGYFLLSKKVSVKPFFERGRTLRASQSIIAYSRAVLSLLPREISFLVGSAAASCRFFSTDSARAESHCVSSRK